MTDFTRRAIRAIVEARALLEEAEELLAFDAPPAIPESSIVHQPSEAAPGWEKRFDEVGRGSEAYLGVTIDTGGVPYPQGAQLAWLAVDRHRNCLAFLVHRRKQLILRVGCGMPHGRKQRIVVDYPELPKRFRLEVWSRGAGTDVRIDGELVAESLPLHIERDGETGAVLDGMPWGRLAVGFGFTGSAEHEPIQHGWTWSALTISAGT